MNSRLLHAAARGARIQVLCDEWEEDRCVMVWDLQTGQCDYRIHPSDEHLAYGPVSTALRGMAIDIRRPTEDLYWRMARDCYLIALGSEWPDDENHRGMCLLILSEILADEGL